MDLSNEQKTCPICLETLNEKNICVTECNHTFCLKCIIFALRQKNTCPLCRAEICTKDEKIERMAAKIEELHDNLWIYNRLRTSDVKMIDHYKQIYLTSMMKIQDDKQLINEQNKEIKKQRLIIKLKNLGIKDNDNWRRKWKIISQISKYNLNYTPKGFTLDKNPKIWGIVGSWFTNEQHLDRQHLYHTILSAPGSNRSIHNRRHNH